MLSVMKQIAIITVFVIVILGFAAWQRTNLKDNGSTLPTTPASIFPSPAVSTASSNNRTSPPQQENPIYAQWKTVVNEGYKVQFKIPPEQTYYPTLNRINPADISVYANQAYDGGSRRQALLKIYRLTPQDVSIEERTSINGIPYLIVRGLTDTARAEGVEYTGVMARSASMLLLINGSKSKAGTVDGIMETLQFTGTVPGFADRVACMKFDPIADSAYGKQGDDYYYAERLTRKLDENYTRNSKPLYITLHVYENDTFSDKDVPFNLTFKDYPVAPYVQEVILTVKKDDVVRVIGQEKFDRARDIGFTVSYSNMKTSDGKMCLEGGVIGPTIPK